MLHEQDSRWSFIPGVRVSYFNMTKEVLPEPRVGVRYALDHGLTLRAAAGLYNEAPPVQDLDKTYGNPDLKSQRAVHYTAGFEKDFREGSASGWTLSNDFFYKHVYDLVARTTAMINPSRPQYYDNSGYGHIYGLEFMGKYKSTTGRAGSLTRFPEAEEEMPRRRKPFPSMTRPICSPLSAERELGRNWKLSARVRYTTGNPYTPIVGASYDVNNDVYAPIRGDIYSQRMGAFFQADVRFDKKWVYDRLDPYRLPRHRKYHESAKPPGDPLFVQLSAVGKGHGAADLSDARYKAGVLIQTGRFDMKTLAARLGLAFILAIVMTNCGKQ